MALWALILLFIFPVTTWAESVQAKVSADEVTYNYESQQVEASGNVKIEYKDIKVESDYALLDQEQDILLATGALTVTNKDNVYHGNKFLYFLKTERGWIYPLQAEIKDMNIEGSAFMDAAEALIKGEDVQAKHSTFTTCNLEHPHYHLSAKSIEYYPNDVIIMHSVWFYEHSVPIFYLPIFYISLNEKNDNFAVRWGRSATEGFFINTQYYYYHFPFQNQSGNLDIRLTQYGGNLYAINQSLQTSQTGTLSLKAGLLEKSNMTNPDVSGYSRDDGATYEPIYDDYMWGFSFKEYLNPKVLTNQDFTHWYHFTEEGKFYPNNKYNLAVTSQSPYPSLNMVLEDKGERTYRTVNLNSNWNCYPDRTSNINLSGQWYYSGYLETPDSFLLNRTYSLNAKKDWNWSNLALVLSENRVYSTDTSGTSLLPDIQYTIPKFPLPVLKDIQIATRYTNMEKFSSLQSSEGQRYALDFTKSSATLWQQGPFTLNNVSSLKYRDFVVNQMETNLTSLSTQLNLTDQFTKEFNTKLGFGYAVTNGLTNSYFGYDGDNDMPGFYAENSWNYASESLTASANTRYNFKMHYAYPLNLSLNWKLTTIAAITFNTIYNWGQGLGLTNLSANYHPNANCNISVGAGYDFSNPDSPWTSQTLLANVSNKISKNWSFSLSANYNYLAHEFSVADYDLIYDWHCRQVVFHYDDVLKEYWMRIVIKAFPNDSLRLTGKNTLDNLLDDIESE
jgi:hypothetical protein